MVKKEDKKCQYCKSKIISLPFKCRHCGQTFCKDHFLPENHLCSYFKPELRFKKALSYSEYDLKFEESERKISAPFYDDRIIVPPASLKYSQDKSTYKLTKERSLKLVSILIVGIIALSVFSLSGYCLLDSILNELKEEKQELENKLIMAQKSTERLYAMLSDVGNDIKKINNAIEENSSSLVYLKSGDTYNLHDPTYKEVIDFLKNNESETEEKLIRDAKNLGIRCAFVCVRLDIEGEYHLIGFETVDEGMVYFEFGTGYRVHPEVGKRYTDCVEGQPYLSSPARIVNILIIW